MLTRIFKRSDPASTAIIILLFAFIRIPAIWLTNAPETHFANGLPLFNLIFDPINAIPILPQFLSFILAILQGVVLSATINNFKLNDRLSNAGLAGYLAINTLIATSPLLTPELISISFIIPMLPGLLDLSRSSKPLPTLFNVGLIAGLAAQFYLPAATSVGLVYLFLIAYRTYAWREVLIPMIGFLFPFACAFTYYFVFDDLQAGMDAYFGQLILFEPAVINKLAGAEVLMPVAFIALLFVPAYWRTLSGNVVRVRKALVVFAILCLPAFPTGLLQNDFSAAWLQVAAITLTLGFTFSVHKIRKPFFSDLIIICTLAAAIYNRFFIL